MEADINNLQPFIFVYRVIDMIQNLETLSIFLESLDMLNLTHKFVNIPISFLRGQTRYIKKNSYTSVLSMYGSYE